MKYQIKISDLEPDGNEPSIYLKALIEDISNTPAISNVELIENAILLETNLTEIELKNKLKLFFSRDFQYIKYISLNLI